MLSSIIKSGAAGFLTAVLWLLAPPATALPVNGATVEGAALAAKTAAQRLVALGVHKPALAQDLAAQALRSLQAGNGRLAAQQTQALAALFKVSEQAPARALGVDLQSHVLQLTPGRVTLAQQEQTAAQLRQTLALFTDAPPPVRPARPLLPLAQVLGRDAKLVRTLQDLDYTPVTGGPPPAAVQSFGDEFVQGAESWQIHLAIARMRHPQVVARWLEVEQERRLFVVASAEDQATVERLRRKLESDGYVVFFYSDCERAAAALCSAQAVGAFCKSAGEVMVLHTREAAATPFVAAEFGLARQIHGRVLPPLPLPLPPPPPARVATLTTPAELLAAVAEQQRRQQLWQRLLQGPATPASAAPASRLILHPIPGLPASR